MSDELMDFVRSLAWMKEDHGDLPQDLDWLIEPTLHALDRVLRPTFDRKALRSVRYIPSGEMVAVRWGGVAGLSQRLLIPAELVARRDERAVIAWLKDQPLYTINQIQRDVAQGPDVPPPPEFDADMDAALAGMRTLIPQPIARALKHYGDAIRHGGPTYQRTTEYILLSEIVVHTLKAGVHAVDVDDETETSE